MRVLIKILFILVFAIWSTSCEEGVFVPENLSEYKAWFFIEDNGFIKKRCLNDLCINVVYKPNELMAINEIKALKPINKNRIDSVVKTYKGSEYFMMEIGHMDVENKDPLRIQGGNLEKYGELTESLAFHINENLLLLKNNIDTLYPSISHLELGYELSGVKKIIVAFPGQFTNNDEIVFIYDDEIFGFGRMKYKFDIDKERIPTIPFKIEK